MNIETPIRPHDDARDKAIEFGRYMAEAADRFMAAMCDENASPSSNEITDSLRALRSAVFEFRKRERRTLA